MSSYIPAGDLQLLDAELVALWTQALRQRSPGHGLARFDDTDMLLHGGVMHPSGHLTVAGLLTLGLHPQRWFPQYVVRAATEPQASDSDRVRARDVRVFDGPIPRILNDILRWAAGAFDTRMESTSDGHVLDVPEYPLEAFRELIANALLHRDLDAWSEALATGIPTVMRLLVSAGIPAPLFHDQGIRFTVILRSPATRIADALTLSGSELRIYEALLTGSVSVRDLEIRLGMRGPAIRKVLRSLRTKKIVVQHGGRGRPTTYEVIPMP